MNSKMFLAAAAALAVAVPNSANAAFQIDSYSWAPGSLYANIQYTPSSLTRNVGVGRFHLLGTEIGTGLTASFLTYCVDVFRNLTPAVFDFAPIGTIVPDATKQDQLLALITNADPLIASAANKNEAAAAVQLAIWEITNEDTNVYDFGTGTFLSSGGNTNGARALAQTYLDNVTNGIWTAPVNGQLRVLYSENSQSQILAGVPEPSTWMMLIGGMAFVGFAARRRTRTTAALA